jgi:hypothetical protein
VGDGDGLGDGEGLGDGDGDGDGLGVGDGCGCGWGWGDGDGAGDELSEAAGVLVRDADGDGLADGDAFAFGERVAPGADGLAFALWMGEALALATGPGDGAVTDLAARYGTGRRIPTAPLVRRIPMPIAASRGRSVTSPSTNTANAAMATAKTAVSSRA